MADPKALWTEGGQVKVPGIGYWLVRYAGPTEVPVHILPDLTGTLRLWGFSDVVEYGGEAYRTWGWALSAWLAEHPDAVFVPDYDRTKDAPRVPETTPECAWVQPKPDHTTARQVLRTEGNARRTRAREVRAAYEVVLREFGTDGLARLEDGCSHGLEAWATALEQDATNLFAAADALKP